MQGLQRRENGRYSTRRVIPLDLQGHYGRREVVKALGTADPATARRLHAIKWVELDDEFERVRRELKTGSKAANEDRPERPDERELVTGAIDRLRSQRAEAAANGTLEDWSHVKRLDLRWHQAVLDGTDEPFFSLESHELGRNVLKAVLDGGVGELVAAVDRIRPKAATGPTLDDLISKWATHAERQPKTVDKARRVAREFVATSGNVRVGGITPDHVQSYKEHLIATCGAPATAINKLNILRALLRFARSNRIIKTDPCEGINIQDRRQAKAARLDYSESDLAQVFASPVYANDARPKGGAGEAAYWLPLMALFTGARLNELGQLRPKDVAEEIYLDASETECRAWVIRIVFDAKDGLRLKNKSSERRVPVHAELVRLGFLRFVEEARASGKKRLFGELKPDKFGTVTAQWSKWYGRYLRGVCGIKDERVTFHSFRHTFKDRARYAGLAPDVQNELTGHETGDQANIYGGLSYPLHPLVEAMARYRVPKLKVPLPPPAYR